jgi:hypothetical protein
MVKRLFTPSQADATLPLVRRIVGDILESGRELRAQVRPGGGGADRARIDALRARLRELMAELEQIGCSYRDFGFEQGLVDFPSKIGSQRVLLCWRSDEPRVAHYHGYEDGFAGRRPIPAHLLDDATGSGPDGAGDGDPERESAAARDARS